MDNEKEDIIELTPREFDFPLPTKIFLLAIYFRYRLGWVYVTIIGLYLLILLWSTTNHLFHFDNYLVGITLIIYLLVKIGRGVMPILRGKTHISSKDKLPHFISDRKR